MTRKRFHLERPPLFTAIFCDDSVAALSRQARAAWYAGAACIDVMGDLFDKSPREWTRKPSAVARQKRLVARIHDAVRATLLCRRELRTPFIHFALP